MIPVEVVEAAEQAGIPDEAVKVAADLVLRMIMEKPLASANPLERELALRQGRLILEAAAPYILKGDVEWTVFRASDGENGSPAENLRYSTKAGAQESIDSRYSTPDLWEPRSRVVGEWRK